MTIFENQIDAAHKIIESFIKEEKPYSVLHAPMQSGKSSTFLLVAAELLRNKFCERTVIFTGNGDIALRNQMENNNVKEFFQGYPRYLRNYVLQGSHNATEIAEEISYKIQCEFEERVTVICGTQLKHYVPGDVRTFYIWDESHYAQSITQQPDHFLKRLGLQVNGSPNPNGNIILSVSATPFSELIDNSTLEQNKVVVSCVPGENYFGVNEMLSSNTIQPLKTTTLKDNINRLKTVTGERNKAIIRCENKTAGYLKSFCHEHNIECHYYIQGTQRTIDELLAKPNPGVILVKGKLRMGQRIKNKKQILWCAETAKNAKLDTTLQGLLGRCCGYTNSGSGPEITIYLHKKVIEQLCGYSTTSLNVCAPAMNVKKDRVHHGSALYPTIPEKITIPIGEREGKSQEDLKQIISEFVRSIEFQNLTVNQVKHSAMMIDDICDHTKIALSCIDEKSYQTHGEVLQRHHDSRSILREIKSGCGWTSHSDKTVRVFYKRNQNEINVRNNLWEVYIQYRTNQPTLLNNFAAKTTGREVFRYSNEACVDLEHNGVQMRIFSQETSTNVESMKEAILEACDKSFDLSDTLITPRRIESLRNKDGSYIGILVNQQVFDALQPGGVIYSSVESLFGTFLKCKKPRGRKPVLQHPFVCRFASIEW